MIPYTAYDIITIINREYDLTRPPVREPYHTFNPGGPLTQHDQNDPRGPGHPVSPSRFTRLIAAIRAFGSRSPQPQPTQIGGLG